MEFKDYYAVLGVDRSATQEEIKRAYKKLARKHHPDLHSGEARKAAEDKFKELNEAYEVLKDPGKRKKYDQLGSDWRAGQDYRPPPGWGGQGFGGRPGGAQESFFWSSGGAEGFSDFFESLFGGGFGGGQGEPRRGGPSMRQKGADREATLRLSLEEAFHGGSRSITLQAQDVDAQGRITPTERKYDVKIPPGVLPGQRIRLAGQGGEGFGGGSRGDLYLKVEIEPHPRFRLEGRDLYTDLPVAPWEAALGGEAQVPTLSGTVTLAIPPGSQSGRRLRLKGKGMPNSRGTPGNLHAVIQIKVPKRLTEEERKAFQELGEISSFDPRAERRNVS